MSMGLTDSCNLCPRQCHATRQGHDLGFCGANRMPEASAICLHMGEEPPLSGPNEHGHCGIVNIFFAHCNLQCIYCQNADIASCHVPQTLVHQRGIEAIADHVCTLLPRGNGLLGLVSAAHYADSLPPLIEAIHQRGMYPTVVYNSGGYESVSTLRTLEGIIDIYLPDLKYMLPQPAKALSHAADYPEVATAAILEMRRQVGQRLIVGDDGLAYRGLLLRHLVLPGHLDNTLQCLEWIADNMPRATLSLMAQYFPPNDNLQPPLDRPLNASEYQQAIDAMTRLGLDNGFTQQLEANSHYRPHFENPENPFS